MLSNIANPVAIVGNDTALKLAATQYRIKEGPVVGVKGKPAQKAGSIHTTAKPTPVDRNRTGPSTREYQWIPVFNFNLISVSLASDPSQLTVAKNARAELPRIVLFASNAKHAFLTRVPTHRCEGRTAPDCVIA
ncbi:hypothetical protein RSAG8_00369, partial [Rhizoctonia solani AG-8 WAC10335]